MNSFRVLVISVFNHWLTEKEASDSLTICYKVAVRNNALKQYFIEENKFINFYKSLGSEAFCFNGNNRIKLSTDSIEFKEYLISGLREDNFNLHHISFITSPIIVKGGYDRTDSIIVDGNEDELIRRIYNLVASNGLYVLEDVVINEFEYKELFS
ncbi:hypothetical protein [Psychrobacter lutiphocae]|uniref:hypothetical protein n=1 Tax=Psychrobacter lutiphocae TaxID=540500 RepID=UPI0003664D92|nr:hypothetical protein [Psychrobacter lutiphocae]